MFNMYTNIGFGSPRTDSRRGISIELSFDAPPGHARAPSSAIRKAYWEHAGKRKLCTGALMALLWHTGPGNTQIYLGTITSSQQDLLDCARKNQSRLALHIFFFDPALDLRALQMLRDPQAEPKAATRLLIEAPLMYESIRPFLQALKKEPTSVPFRQYLVHPSERGGLQNAVVDPPKYTLAPGFEFELACLFPPEAAVQSLKLSIRNQESIDRARSELARASRLDPSQAEAMVDTLTREISLIQGYVAMPQVDP
jgi:hypothetical protein